MESIVERCAGIDIGKVTLKATLRVQGGPRRKTRREVRSFETTTAELLRLRDWLVDEQVTLVGMESTGVYWKPIYHAGRGRGVLVAQCSALEEGARQEDRRQRLGVDR